MKLRLTYANVMSTIAVFLAVSTGGAYAKATLIDGKIIKPNTITAKQVKNGSITTADLSRQTVTALADLAPTVPDGNAYGTVNPPVRNGVFTATVTPTGAGQACVVLAGSDKTYGTWEQTSGGLFTCNNGDGYQHGPVMKGISNGAINAY